MHYINFYIYIYYNFTQLRLVVGGDGTPRQRTRKPPTIPVQIPALPLVSVKSTRSRGSSRLSKSRRHSRRQTKYNRNMTFVQSTTLPTLGESVETPETPGTSKTPETPETPGTSETSETSETPGTRRTSETSETLETPGTLIDITKINIININEWIERMVVVTENSTRRNILEDKTITIIYKKL
jgi:hypothetical protein